MRTPAAAVVAVVLTAFAVLLLHGTYELEGPVVLRVTYDHGLHAGDVLILLAWAAALATLAREASRPRR